MKLTMKAAAACLMLLAASGCVVTDPGSGSKVDPAAAVGFTGYAVIPNQGVELESRKPDGTFETFASTSAADSGWLLDDGILLFRWEVAAVVPHWQGLGCDRTAEVRAMGVAGENRVPLMTFEERDAHCVRAALAAGRPFNTAVEMCAAEQTATIQLRGSAATTLIGNFEITTQAEADALVCATTIDGDLTVRPGVSVVRIANLQEVTGNVSIEVDDSGSHSTAGHADLPILQRIGKGLRFHHAGRATNVTINVGLSAVTSLQGNLEVQIDGSNANASGPANLRSVAGDVHIRAAGDFYGSSLLTSLETVGGDLVVAASGGSSADLLNKVQTVGGSVTVDGLSVVNRPVLGGLQSVGGNMTVKETVWGAPGPPAFAALSRVAGTLRVESPRVFGGGRPVVTMGSASLSVAALALISTQFSVMPFAAATPVAPSGAVTIVDNARLCQTSVDTFVAAQRQAGWSGALTVSGNTGSCTP